MSVVFVKMYIDAIHSGMIADMGMERWTTLCVLASFMNEKGECYPSQDVIAHRLGVSRATANARIQRLCKYRWNGKPIVEKKRVRGEGGKWANVVYRITDACPLTIFKPETMSR